MKKILLTIALASASFITASAQLMNAQMRACHIPMLHSLLPLLVLCILFSVAKPNLYCHEL